MKLAEIRRVAIRRQVRVHFRLPNGLECTITEGGLVKIPELRTVPDFNVETVLPSVDTFRLEPVTAEANRSRQQSVSVAELEKMVAATAPGASQAADHDE
ncbi:MAG: hypothetical protein JNL98_16945 [Bryobacterales bacterium]|nr:hypothetical protein [Bryobacterales bacterium]